MNLVVFEDKAYNGIIEKIDNLEKSFADIVKKANNPLINKWLDNQDVMDILKCSPKYLQNLRSNKVIPYCKIDQKIYYKASDIEKYLEGYYDKPESKKEGKKC